MRNFEFCYSTRLLFGRGERNRVGSELKKMGAQKVLVHFGGGSVIRSGLLESIHTQLEAEGIAYVDLGGVQPNPRLKKVREGIALCCEEQVDAVLACGGGSVIDSAKAIALGAANEADIWHTIETWSQPEKALPLCVALTLPAAASETDSAFVITNDDTKQKLLYACEKVTPKFAVIDPELFLSIPPKVYAPAICDMLSHVIERYFTAEPFTETSDGLCEATLRTLIRNGKRLLNGESTYEVWSELALSANVAHNGMCGLGRLPEWCCHMMEHELSAFYDVSHGAGLAVLTPAWMKYIYKNHLELFAQFAVKVMGVEPNTKDLESLAKEGISRLEALYRAFELPSTMEELGIRDDSLYETMAKRVVGYETDPNGRLGFLQPLSWEDVVRIFRLASHA